MSAATVDADIGAWISSLGYAVPSVDAFREMLNGSPAAKVEAAASLTQACVITG